MRITDIKFIIFEQFAGGLLLFEDGPEVVNELLLAAGDGDDLLLMGFDFLLADAVLFGHAQVYDFLLQPDVL